MEFGRDRSDHRPAMPRWRAFVRSVVRVVRFIYRERELILRTDGRVRYLRMTQPLQAALSVVVIGVFAWAFGMTALWDFQRDVIDEKVGQIKDAEVAYGDLLDEVIGYQEKVAAATAKLREKHAFLLRELTVDDPGFRKLAQTSQAEIGPEAGNGAPKADSKQSLKLHLTQVDIELEQMTETTNLLESSLSKVKARLARAEQERDTIARKGSSLQDQVRELQDQLVKARARAARLDRLRKDLDQSLTGARVSYEKVVEERNLLENRKHELENELGSSRARGDSLQLEVAKLGRELDKSREKVATVVGHRSALQALVSRLEAQLQTAEHRIEGLESDFGEVVARLEESVGDREGENVDVPLSDLPFHKRADVLLSQLGDLQSAQEAVLDQLRARTGGNVAEAERVIQMAGLDLAEIIERAGGPPDGQGGPIVPTATASALTPALATTLSDVEGHLARWEILKSILRSLPLVSPVDYYHVASRFGKRRDPFTKKWSVHHGLDLAGWNKAPVYTTAPGTVAFAGRKGRYGKMIEIDHGNGLRTRYGHLFKISVRKGERISHRHKIGLLGSTGRSTGPHVHYEVLFNGKPVDPLKFIKAGRYVFKGPKATTEAEADDGKDAG